MSASMLFGKPNWGWGGANCDLYRGLFNLSAALGRDLTALSAQLGYIMPLKKLRLT